MLSDPLAVAAAAPNPAYNFSVIKSDGYGSERKDAASGLTMVINHENGKTGHRHYVKLSNTKDATNPYSMQVQKQTVVASISISVPNFGFTEADVVNHVKALLDTLADADFSVVKLLQFQS